MGNYALQKGPSSFLKLRISPWRIPFLLLLCFSFLSLFIFSRALSLPYPRLAALICFLPPSLCSLRAEPRGAPAPGGGARREQAPAWASALAQGVRDAAAVRLGAAGVSKQRAAAGASRCGRGSGGSVPRRGAQCWWGARMQGVRGGRLGWEAERCRVGAARAAVDEQRKRQSGARERQQACTGGAGAGEAADGRGGGAGAARGRCRSEAA
jgi:hypothetical protein